MMLSSKSKKTLLVVLSSFLAGIAAGWFLYGPEQGSTEQYAAEKRQVDGSLMLEKVPGATDKADAMAPEPVIPAGGKIERTAVVKVQPKPKPKPQKAEPVRPGPDGLCPAAVEEACPPVTVRFDLVKLDNDERRLIGSSPDGEVTGGIDTPILPPLVRDVPRWAAGMTLTHDGRMGAFIDRDLGPFRVGAEVGKAEGDGVEARIKAGLRF